MVYHLERKRKISFWYEIGNCFKVVLFFFILISEKNVLQMGCSVFEKKKLKVKRQILIRTFPPSFSYKLQISSSTVPSQTVFYTKIWTGILWYNKYLQRIAKKGLKYHNDDSLFFFQDDPWSVTDGITLLYSRGFSWAVVCLDYLSRLSFFSNFR